MLFSILMMLSVSLRAEDAAVGVIAHPSVATDQLTLKELRAIFTMKQRVWPSGEVLTVFVLPNDAAVHKRFSKKVLGVFPRQLESVWHRLVYSGTGSAPIQVSSEAEMVELVAGTAGAIGYISTETEHEKNKNISIH